MHASGRRSPPVLWQHLFGSQVGSEAAISAPAIDHAAAHADRKGHQALPATGTSDAAAGIQREGRAVRGANQITLINQELTRCPIQTTAGMRTFIVKSAHLVPYPDQNQCKAAGGRADFGGVCRALGDVRERTQPTRPVVRPQFARIR